MPIENIPAKNRHYDPKMMQILREKILPNCSEKGKEAYTKWWNQGDPITGFIKDEYTEIQDDGNEYRYTLDKDGNQTVLIKPQNRHCSINGIINSHRLISMHSERSLLKT